MGRFYLLEAIRPSFDCNGSYKRNLPSARQKRPCIAPRSGVNTIATEVIHTQRLDLLPLRLEHAEEMATVLSDPTLHTFTGGTPDTPEALRSRYQRMVAGSPDPTVTWHNWVIRLRNEARLTGTVQATVSHSGHVASAVVATACGLAATDKWHDGEIRWHRTITP